MHRQHGFNVTREDDTLVTAAVASYRDIGERVNMGIGDSKGVQPALLLFPLMVAADMRSIEGESCSYNEAQVVGFPPQEPRVR